MTNKNILNRICFSIDSSLSMSHLQDSVIKVFDNQVKNLIELSKQLNQEIRITVYTFNDTVKNLIFDVDVFRVKSLKGLYHPSGNTSLIDGSYIPITELIDHKDWIIYVQSSSVNRWLLPETNLLVMK